MDTRRWMIMLLLELLHIMSHVQGKPTVTIEPVNHYTATTLTIICDLTGTTTFSLAFKKDGTALYNCLLVGSLCNPENGIDDYSSVDWSTQDKGIITISNANRIRDSGEWTCSGDSGTDPSDRTRLDVTDANCGQELTIVNGNVEYEGNTYGYTAEYTCENGFFIEGNTTTTCQANGEWIEVSPVCSANLTTSTPTTTTTPISVFAETSPTTYTISLPTGLAKTTTNTEKQTIGLIAGGVGIVVVICCIICTCAIIRRKVNTKKRRRRQERRKEVKANAQISESL